MTPLDKPLKREIQIGDAAYTLTIDPLGLKLVAKGRRNGLELAWSDLVILSLSPVLAATVALAAAWLAARRALDKGPRRTASSVSSGAGSVE